MNFTFIEGLPCRRKSWRTQWPHRCLDWSMWCWSERLWLQSEWSCMQLQWPPRTACNCRSFIYRDYLFTPHDSFITVPSHSMNISLRHTGRRKFPWSWTWLGMRNNYSWFQWWWCWSRGPRRLSPWPPERSASGWAPQTGQCWKVAAAAAAAPCSISPDKYRCASVFSRAPVTKCINRGLLWMDGGRRWLRLIKAYQPQRDAVDWPTRLGQRPIGANRILSTYVSCIYFCVHISAVVTWLHWANVILFLF